MGYRTWHFMVFQLTLCRHWIIFVSAGGEPQICSVLHVLCVYSSSLHQGLFTGIHAQCSTCAWNFIIFFSLHIVNAQTRPFCSAEIQQSSKWSSFLVKTTYTSCRLLHRSTRVATVTLCLCAAVAGLQRTSDSPCCARQRCIFTAGGDLYATEQSREDSYDFTNKETF